ncbi:hypothetical protein NEOLEDRAFT_73012 [Neolentinus lepideus HHB14362 ss-1]|uniref:Uncharacterized protein n=1 Tax=Neolentinus lepideus HHB14362 ss-1 TaxID=1314782 RepID=A0A165N2C7_9AGAM|nr:hypothetical protein NEOLEDRAFT_73012 [Neolentinus lepideus HHB14362 ss-1]
MMHLKPKWCHLFKAEDLPLRTKSITSTVFQGMSSHLLSTDCHANQVTKPTLLSPSLIHPALASVLEGKGRSTMVVRLANHWENCHSSQKWVDWRNIAEKSADRCAWMAESRFPAVQSLRSLRQCRSTQGRLAQRPHRLRRLSQGCSLSSAP